MVDPCMIHDREKQCFVPLPPGTVLTPHPADEGYVVLFMPVHVIDHVGGEWEGIVVRIRDTGCDVLHYHHPGTPSPGENLMAAVVTNVPFGHGGSTWHRVHKEPAKGTV